MLSTSKLGFLDLYCGCGGFSLGFMKVGFKHVLGVDNWDIACDTYALNVGKVLKTDVTIFNGVEGQVDIILGSPPCQSFSLANTKNRSCDLTLTNAFFRIISEIKPKVWIMENVPGVYDFVQAPYKYTFDMSDYGLLQKRRRFFCSNIPLQPPLPEHKWLSTKQVEKLMLFRPEAIHHHYQTITGRYNSFVKTTPHITENDSIRLLDHVEAMAVQSFPFYFKLPDGLTQREIEVLIGNAVPPLFAYKLGLYVRDYLNKNGLPPKFIGGQTRKIEDTARIQTTLFRGEK